MCFLAWLQAVGQLNVRAPRACRDFRARNPAVAQFDRFLTGQADPRPVSALFAAKQLEHMRADRSEEEAYALARIWLAENGYEVLERMGVKLADPEGDAERAALVAAHQAAQQRQAEMTRAVNNRIKVMGKFQISPRIRRRAAGTPAAGPRFVLNPAKGETPPPYTPIPTELDDA